MNTHIREAPPDAEPRIGELQVGRLPLGHRSHSRTEGLDLPEPGRRPVTHDEPRRDQLRRLQPHNQIDTPPRLNPGPTPNPSPPFRPQPPKEPHPRPPGPQSPRDKQNPPRPRAPATPDAPSPHSPESPHPSLSPVDNRRQAAGIGRCVPGATVATWVNASRGWNGSANRCLFEHVGRGGFPSAPPRPIPVDEGLVRAFRPLRGCPVGSPCRRSRGCRAW